MLMSVVDSAVAGHGSVPFYPEIAGKRILINGVSTRGGANLVTAFADHKPRLIVNFADESQEMQALAELITPTAIDLRVYHDGLATADAVTRFARTAAQIHGGLDAVINIVHLAAGEVSPAASVSEVEQHVSQKLMAPCLISKIAANRMALTWSEGIILNVVIMEPSVAPADVTIAGVTRATLAGMTRKQAQEWAEQAVRINAISPKATGQGGQGDMLCGEKDITALALYLSSKRGAKLTGHIFDADGTAQSRC